MKQTSSSDWLNEKNDQNLLICIYYDWYIMYPHKNMVNGCKVLLKCVSDSQYLFPNKGSFDLKTSRAQECGSIDMSKFGHSQAGKIKSKYNFILILFLVL